MQSDYIVIDGENDILCMVEWLPSLEIYRYKIFIQLKNDFVHSSWEFPEKLILEVYFSKMVAFYDFLLVGSQVAVVFCVVAAEGFEL